MNSEARSNAATVIEAQSLVKGHVEGDEDLAVLGRLEGTVSLTGNLAVEPGGVVAAEVSVNQAVVRGTVIGNITARELLQIASGGRVVGDLTAPRIIIDDGAALRGRVEMGDFDEAGVRQRPGAEAARVPPPRPPTLRSIGGAASGPTPAIVRNRAAGLSAAPRSAEPRELSERRGARAASADERLSPGRGIAAAGSPDRQGSSSSFPATVAAKEKPAPEKPSSAAADPATDLDEQEQAAAAVERKPPRPPTTAGKKSRARRR